MRSPERDDVSLHRIAELEAALARATASLRTQNAMLRGSVRDQSAKLARAREVQALTAADFATRLAAMENEIALLVRALESMQQQQGETRPWLKPLLGLGGRLDGRLRGRLGGAWRRVSTWLPTPTDRSVGDAQPPSTPAGEREETGVKLLLKAPPSQLAAWKALLGKRR